MPDRVLFSHDFLHTFWSVKKCGLKDITQRTRRSHEVHEGKEIRTEELVQRTPSEEFEIRNDPPPESPSLILTNQGVGQK